MRFIRSFGRFWWDFIIGADWKIAAVVAGVLAAGGVVAAAGANDPPWLAPACGVAVLLAFVVSFAMDLRRRL